MTNETNYFTAKVTFSNGEVFNFFCTNITCSHFFDPYEDYDLGDDLDIVYEENFIDNKELIGLRREKRLFKKRSSIIAKDYIKSWLENKYAVARKKRKKRNKRKKLNNMK